MRSQLSTIAFFQVVAQLATYGGGGRTVTPGSTPATAISATPSVAGSGGSSKKAAAVVRKASSLSPANGGPYLGLIVGNYGPGVASFNQWLGCKVAVVGEYNTQTPTWSGMDDIDWVISRYPAGTPIVWSFYTYPSSSSLSAVAGGAGDTYYQQWADDLLAHGTPAPDGNFYVRILWEMPGTWFSWGAQGAHNPSAYIRAYQHFADVFHGASPKFKMVWDTFEVATPGGGDNSKYYPGDSYVDVVGQDEYPETTSESPSAAWNDLVSKPNGMQWIERFAAAHNKPTAYSEWGINSNNAGPLVHKMYNWFVTHNVRYQSYFNLNNPGAGTQFVNRLDNNQYPAAGEIYRQDFCLSRTGLRLPPVLGAG